MRKEPERVRFEAARPERRTAKERLNKPECLSCGGFEESWGMVGTEETDRLRALGFEELSNKARSPCAKSLS